LEKNKILLVDDEESVLDFLSYNLKNNGYVVETASNGLNGLNKYKEFMPNLIIVDVMMPEMNGIDFCSTLREENKNDEVIVVFLTARSEDYTQIAALESGADDYITKPIKPRLLVAKIKSLLKRKQNKESEILKHKEVFLNKDKHLVVFKNNEIILPRKEFQILQLFLENPGKVFKREDILNSVWGKDVFVGGRTIDVHIKRIRNKLGFNLISTIKGIGYKLNDK
tara:strand:- start:572 stop:1246 length:675 start_codon:yes stop_codon:yes gene_type:complete